MEYRKEEIKVVQLIRPMVTTLKFKGLQTFHSIDA